MQTDRATKALRFLIAVGLWAHLAKDVFLPVPAVAQGPGLAQPVRLVATEVTMPVNVLRQAQPLEVKVLK